MQVYPSAHDSSVSAAGSESRGHFKGGSLAGVFEWLAEADFFLFGFGGWLARGKLPASDLEGCPSRILLTFGAVAGVGEAAGYRGFCEQAKAEQAAVRHFKIFFALNPFLMVTGQGIGTGEIGEKGISAGGNDQVDKALKDHFRVTVGPFVQNIFEPGIRFGILGFTENEKKPLPMFLNFGKDAVDGRHMYFCRHGLPFHACARAADYFAVSRLHPGRGFARRSAPIPAQT